MHRAPARTFEDLEVACWIMKVYKRLAQGGMASLCARTGDLLLEALPWLLSVPHGRDH